MYPTHQKHTKPKTTPPQSYSSQKPTQVPTPPHQARTIQSASQTLFHLTPILNQKQYTQFKYTHANAKVEKRNNRQHVGLARRETPPHLQKQYNTLTTTKRTKTKIQIQENRENPQPTIF
jgi:hypothetical protein